MSASPLPSISESSILAGSPSASTITFGAALNDSLARQEATIARQEATIARQEATITRQEATITRQEAAIAALMERLDTRPPA